MAFAAGLIDLEKAFERVPYAHLVAAARQWDYPFALLRMTLGMYKVVRHVGFGGVWGRGGGDKGIDSLISICHEGAQGVAAERV